MPPARSPGQCSAPRLRKHLCFRQLAEAASQSHGRRSSLVMIQNFPAASQRQQTRHRLLDHRLLAVERQQLLGPLLAAQRPETRAATASQNHGIEIRVLASRVPRYERTRFHNLKSRTRFLSPAPATASRAHTPARTPKSTADAPRNFSRHAGTTTASPFARVTGSQPGTSITPQPSTATRICTEFLPESSRVARLERAPYLKHVHRQNKERQPAAHGDSCRSRICSVARAVITFPDVHLFLHRCQPSFKCNSRGRP